MKPTLNEQLIAYLALLSGLSISAVAVYYSVIGLTAIFAAATVPIIIMGTALEVSKLVATVWLKQNWTTSPKSIRLYLIVAIAILMFITSMGIFGFLSKAHSDQSLVSGEVLSKIAVYDEKIKTAKENIEADRRQLRQMDEAVDQVMARSTTEEGAARANAIRKAQARDRSALAKSIETNQKLIAALNDEAAPIRAEIRKVEAEVGPLKYIAAFVYGNTDPTILEKAVTWVIIIIIVVFDPLAVILLLASQISFQHFRERAETKQPPESNKELTENNSPEEKVELANTNIDNIAPVPKQQEEVAFMQKQIGDIWKAMEQPCSTCGTTMIYSPEVGISCPNVDCDKNTVEPNKEPDEDEFNIKNHPYLFNVPKTRHPPGIDPVKPQVFSQSVVDTRLTLDEILELDSDIQGVETTSSFYIQNEEQKESNLWTSATVHLSVDEENPKIKLAREKEEKIKSYAQQVKEGRIDLSQVPDELIAEVKVRV